MNICSLKSCFRNGCQAISHWTQKQQLANLRPKQPKTQQLGGVRILDTHGISFIKNVKQSIPTVTWRTKFQEGNCEKIGSALSPCHSSMKKSYPWNCFCTHCLWGLAVSDFYLFADLKKTAKKFGSNEVGTASTGICIPAKYIEIFGKRWNVCNALEKNYVEKLSRIFSKSYCFIELFSRCAICSLPYICMIHWLSKHKMLIL